jgi:DNA-binding transcriptional regulator YbjK
MSDILIGVVVAIISVLVTWVISQTATAKSMKLSIAEYMLNHEKQHHQTPTLTILEKHEQTCEVNFRAGVKNDLKAIISGLSFLIAKQPGGNPKDFGL